MKNARKIEVESIPTNKYKPKTISENWDPLRLKTVRTLQHMSQREFAAYAKVSANHIVDIERGKISPSVEICEAIMNLGYDAEWFIKGKSKELKVEDIISLPYTIHSILQKLQKLDEKQLLFISEVVDKYYQMFAKNKVQENSKN